MGPLQVHVGINDNFINKIMVNKSKLWFAETSGMLSPSLFLGSSVGSLDSGLKLKNAKPVIHPSWRFRGSHDVLHKIWMNSSSAVIFFDGALKGNLGVSGVGGLVFFSLLFD